MTTHPVEVGIYVPQLAMGWDDLLQRARWVEELGFHSFWLMDHLYPAGAADLPSFEAWTAATALLASTTRLRVGHMVLCNNFRHPALLGKMATSLDVISGGRLILGLGSGSVASEHHEGGFPWGGFAERSERLGESLEILTRMFAGHRTTFEGRHHQVRDLVNAPLPVQKPRPPILVGGGGARTLELTARYADIWNCVTYDLDKLDRRLAELHLACERVGRDPAEIRLSTEAVMAVAPDEASLPAVRSLAERRFGGPGFGLEAGGLVGTPDMVVERLLRDVDRGITLFVFFLHDRASRETLELIAEQVLPHLTRR